MIAIITWISVLERTKEIGILRSIGASKGDISRIFNAETVIEGLVAGLLGTGITLLLNIPINAIIKSLAGISGIASLSLSSALILIALSVFLTVVAGLIPSRLAAKKDPVVALRTE
jgi:putative ABC transport system permease protein